MSKVSYIKRYSNLWHIIETNGEDTLISIYSYKTRKYRCKKTKTEYLDDFKRYPSNIPVYPLEL